MKLKKGKAFKTPTAPRAIPPKEDNGVWVERAALFASLFFMAFGMGLISDGNKIYSQQLKRSERVDYKSTMNPYK